MADSSRSSGHLVAREDEKAHSSRRSGRLVAWEVARHSNSQTSSGWEEEVGCSRFVGPQISSAGWEEEVGCCRFVDCLLVAEESGEVDSGFDD